jgi:hypothetical protein
MSKYEPLGEYLKKQGKDLVPLTFAEIERIIGAKLPASSKYRAWWSNNDFNSVMTKVWLDAGYESEQVDMARRRLLFRRVRKPKASAPGSEEATPIHPAYGFLKGLVRITPGTDLTQPADPELADYLDAKYGPEQR